MRIDTNIAAIDTQRSLSKVSASLTKSVERLSSGLRINRAGDDAAGLTVSSKLRSQATGVASAQRNAQDDISMIQTADGGMSQTQSILKRMQELAKQAGGEGLTTDGKNMAQKEIEQLKKDIDIISDRTSFNGKKLLDGSYSNDSSKTGTFSEGNIEISFANLSTTALGVDEIDVTKQSTEDTLKAIDKAIETVNSTASQSRETFNRLVMSSTSNLASLENNISAISQIHDTDFASETMQFTRNQILTQPGTAILAQANHFPSQVLSLLK